MRAGPREILTHGINPLFTIVYGLLGILPWLIYWLIKRIKNPHIPFICLISASILMFGALVYFIFFSSTIAANYSFEMFHKIIIVSVAFVLLVATIIALFFINRFFVKRYGDFYCPYKVAFVCLVSEVLLMLILNSFVKTITFQVNYWIIFFAQAIVFFINVPLNTFVVQGLLILTSKIKGQALI